MLTNLIDETLGAFPRVAQIGVDFSGPDCLLGAVLLKKKLVTTWTCFQKKQFGFRRQSLNPNDHIRGKETLHGIGKTFSHCSRQKNSLARNHNESG